MDEIISKSWVIQNDRGQFYRMTSSGCWSFDDNFKKAKLFVGKGHALRRIEQIKEDRYIPEGTVLTVREVTTTLGPAVDAIKVEQRELPEFLVNPKI